MVMGLAGSKGPTVFDSHERLLAAPPEAVGGLLERLGTTEDVLWPVDHWPALVLDRALEVGSRGGHAPMRYHVVEHEPGQLVRFRFSGPPGFLGYHEFLVERAPELPQPATRLRHVVVLNPQANARLTWPLIWQPLHDALIEELLDRAEAVVAGRSVEPRAWPWRVRALRRLLRGRLPPAA